MLLTGWCRRMAANVRTAWHRPSRAGRRYGFRPRLERLEALTLPAAITWICGSGDWATPGCWDLGRLPGADDDVVISVPQVITVSYTGGSTVIRSLTGGNPSNTLAMSGGTLRIDAGATLLGALLLSDGTLFGDSDLDVYGPLTWTGGAMGAPFTGGRTQAFGGLEISGSAAKRLIDRRALVNHGTAIWTGGRIDLFAGSIVTNAPGALFLADSATSLILGAVFGSNEFQNAGTFRSRGSVFMEDFFLAVRNTGTMEVESGTLSLRSGSVSATGRFEVAAGANLELHGATTRLDEGSEVTGGGDLSVSADMAFLHGAVSVLGNVRLGPATGIEVTAKNFSVGGQLSVERYTIVNVRGGTVLGAGSMTVAATDTTKLPPGVLNLEAGTTLTADSVTLFPGGPFPPGELTLQAGSVFTLNESLTNGGIVYWNGGQLDGSGVLDIAATGQLLLGGDDPKLLTGVTVQNSGTASWTGAGDLWMSDGGSFLNQPGGIFDAANDAGVVYTGGATPTFTNAGLFVKSGGKGQTVFGSGVTFTNSGTVDVRGGTLFLAGVFTNYEIPSGTLRGGAYELRGTLQFIAADVRVLAADLTLRNSERGDDRLVDENGGNGLGGLSRVVSGGLLGLVGVGTALLPFLLPPLIEAGTVIIGPGSEAEWAGGEYKNGTTRVEAGGVLNITGKANKVLDNHTLDNRGTINDTGTGGIGIVNNSRIVNQAQRAGSPPTYYVRAASYYVGDGTSRFSNRGRLHLGVGAVPQFLGGFTFEQAGAVEVEADSMLTVEGVLTLVAGSQLRLLGGVVAAWFVDVQPGAELSGTGAVVGDVHNAGRLTVGGRDAAGLIYIVGSYTQTADGALALDLGSPDLGAGVGYDWLYVGGPATLAGRLELSLLPGYRGRDGDGFDLITASGLAGQFEPFPPPPGFDPGLVLDALYGDGYFGLSVRRQG